MSIIAGIYVRDKKREIPQNVCGELKKLISRRADENIFVFGDSRAFFVKADVGAFGEAGHYADAENSISLLAGAPLLSNAENGDRERDLRQIHESLANKNTEILTGAQGVFCLANYRSENQSLILVADRLGVRPLYYWISENYVIFSTALRVLENLSEIPKRMCVRAVTEIAALGYALSDRTPYEDIFLLKPGEILEVQNERISQKKYWRWDEIKISGENEENLVDKLFKRFTDAVTRRRQNDTASVAYLSGGLDSRCIVGCLADPGARVHTFNFARPNTQDQILGRKFAELVKTIHTEVPKESGDHVPDYSLKMAEAWQASKNRRSFPAERPALVWSGEGGSVALGHVHLSRKIVELMRAGQKDAAITEFLQREQIYLSPKLLHPQVLNKISAFVRHGIREELDGFDCEDAARGFYLFLLLNDQRRKLAKHFENIDLHRLEFQLPFFDGAFLETIISIPIELCLGHKFYVKWLGCFPKAVTSVAWQAYPGHEPCPLPVPEGLSYQWDKRYQADEQKSLDRKLVAEAKELLKSEDFPTEILNKINIRLAVWLHRTGWRDYSYIIENASVYHKYWRICKGDYSL